MIRRYDLRQLHGCVVINALDNEQLRIDRVHKSLREIADLFRPCAATILQDEVRKELCTLFIGPFGMRIDVFPFLPPFKLDGVTLYDSGAAQSRKDRMLRKPRAN